MLAKQHQRTWERQMTEHQARTQAAMDSFWFLFASLSIAERIAKAKVRAKAMRAWSLKVKRQSFPKNMSRKAQRVTLRGISEIKLERTHVKAAAARRSIGKASMLSSSLTWTISRTK